MSGAQPPASQVELRVLKDRDIADAVALFNRASRAAYGTDGMSEREFRLFLESPTVDPHRDVRVAIAPDGALIGYTDLYDQNALHTRFWFDLKVDPERGTPEVVQALIAWMEARAQDAAEESAFLRGFVASVDEAVKVGLEHAGYALIRHSFRMLIDLDGEPARPQWPPGIDVRTMTPGEERDVYEVDDECFSDHWEHVREPYEEWEHWTVKRDGFDPALWFLAWDRERAQIAGYALCEPHDAEPDMGFVHHLGVRRPWRRRGLALALLHHVFAEFQRRGFRRVGLGVDAENLTGAVHLYERAGMRVVRRFDAYEKRLAGRLRSQDRAVASGASPSQV
ncbi:MAG: GNAT family N-acetyltransferase [Actinomycetota bacterium]|nr:GNAT family N-acetyltransferase [Actinomycetota bacterium]